MYATSPTSSSHRPDTPPADEALWNRRAILFLLALTTLRLVIHACGVIGVLGDEAYYWEWGNHLAAGYYSKPPLIGWIMGMLRLSGLDHAFGLKTTANLLSTLSLAGLYLFTRQWFGARTAWWTLATAGLSAGSLMLGSFLTIDSPLVAMWSVALAASSSLLRNGPRPGNVIVLTLSLGIGMLGKQMMMLFPVLLFIAAWRLRVPRRTWRAVIACSLLSFLALLPPVLWNAHHDWVTFKHTGHHFEGAPVTPAAIGKRLAEYIGSQFMVAGPVALALAIAALRNRESRHRYRIPLIFGVIGWTACLLMNLRQEVNPNWPAVYLFSWMPAGIAWAMDRRPGLAKAALWLNAAITLAALGAILFPSLWNKGDKKFWYGWDSLAREVDALQPTTNPGEKPLLIVAGSRFTAAQVAFLSPRRPELHTWYYGREFIPGTTRQRGVTSQFDLWPGPSCPVTRPLVVLVDENLPLPQGLENALVNPAPPKKVHVRFGRKNGANFNLIRAEGLTSWPPPPFE
ncbi:glycosyltransferase family 39 protein [Luteolibacter ambystomatis]|uniref:Glycosyltransferase family 39 protein n=1 Tax=Luteolibacter ambystomatis TaxID=2824561 RepID=A0A975G5M8_9BACT|nr:glycosyltransferase family 39 protein [Luteolibacter ambystomatis]QUE49774.1 glycosyltransferase family 39 protein [Luteolibacter ambystomatis]